jgi:CRISPR-associated protein Csm3
LLSGLHIGDSKDNTDIGGIDSPVVRRRDNKEPYIPGSSIKGKMRCLMEQISGASEVGGGMRTSFDQKSPEIQKINYFFGYANDDIPSAVIVRDAYLSPESREKLSTSEFTDMPFTEAKMENSIHRVKGKADAPRTIERVPAGSEFHLSFIINIYEKNGINVDELGMLKKGLELLNNDYLGGSGSRGYGHVYIDVDNLKVDPIPLSLD